MWVFTKHGFFSAVQTREDKDKIMIRSRNKDHLVNLMVECSLKLDVITTMDSDYRYRIIVSKPVLVDMLTFLALDIDYSNFKDAVYDEHGRCDYERALHEVWYSMYKTQKV